MKVFSLIILILIALGGIGYWYYDSLQTPNNPVEYIENSTEGQLEVSEAPLVEVIAKNLTVPWEILFLPDGELLVTERPGRILLLRSGQTIEVEGVEHVGEGGLLGAALHPNFNENKLLYLYQTTRTENGLRNRVVRYELTGAELQLDRVILDNLPGAQYHDGGRIAFGPDGFLYVALGDALNEPAAQNTENLAGSILRVTVDGEVPTDNPFSNEIYSYGHRNPQGLVWDVSGNLWSSEHGRSGARSGFDEINLIERGGNYGWPQYEGDEVASGINGPQRHSGASDTWAPGGIAYLNGSLFMPGLRGETLYEAVLSDTEIIEWREHFVGEYGRLRTVQVGPDGLLYLLTSNRDGRGLPDSEDDRIIRINPERL